MRSSRPRPTACAATSTCSTRASSTRSGVAETLAYIEERYGVEVPDDVLLSDEFTTIDGIARSIVELVADAAAPPTGLQQT